MKQIPLSQGLFALVDDEDFEYLNQFKWSAVKDGKTYYAVRNFTMSKNKRVFIKMHRLILGLTNPEIQGDHIDHNGLNNQRCNLRACINLENQRNRRKRENAKSKYKGVYEGKKGKKGITWRARIWVNGKNIGSGVFKSEIEAAKKYDEMAKFYYGEFANLNFKE